MTTTTTAAAATSASTLPSGSPTIADLIDAILDYQYNPAAIQQVAFNYLNEVTNGTVTIVDPTNPYVHAIETSAVNTAAFMQKDESLNRKQYPIAAQTMSDLYLHMADVDYVDRFAVPATTTWGLAIGYTELLDKLVTNPATGLGQLVIPRNTYFTVNDTIFSLQYPIVIQQMAHGGLSITYDTTDTSPLQTLSTNLVTWKLRQQSATMSWVYMELPLQQFDIISRTGTLTSAKVFSLTIPVADQFYYCRVYALDATTGLYNEIAVTYSTEIYDVNTPTAVCTVGTNTQTNATQVVVTIPQIYATSGLLTGTIRVDVYETQGPVNMVMANYATSAFSCTFLAIDPNDSTIYTAPMSTFSALIAYCDQNVIAGSDAVPFATLQAQVINNSTGAQNTPITPAQLTEVLEQDGFGVVKVVDNITNREYLATSAMPTPVDSSLITAANSTIETVSTSFTQAVTFASVVDNDTSITIKPSMLYQNVNGIISMVSDAVIAQLNAMTASNRATAISDGGYLWSPWYYVVDNTGSELALRAYYLDDPTVVTKLWVSENDTTGFEVSTDTYTLTLGTNGYTLVLSTTSNAAYQALDDSDVYCQLSFIPPGETTRAYLQGTLTGTTSAGERQFTFDLSTNFNVDANSYLYLTKFFMYNTTARLTATPLDNTIDVIYSTTATKSADWVTAAVDQVVGTFLVPTGAYGITNEQLEIEFGDYLETLWTSCRTVVSTLTYETYQTNVPYTYQEDVFQVDPTTGAGITIVDGAPVYTILHYKGDTVLNTDGTVSYQHVIGDTILDAITGDPIPTTSRGLTQELDLMLIDATYRFANDTVAPTYVTQLTDTVVSWLTESFPALDEQLLENTSIYFYPVANMGTVQVYGPDGTTVYSIEAGQSFALSVRLTATNYANENLKTKLKSSAISTIYTALQATTISSSDIISALNAVFGSDVVSFTFSGLGGTYDLDTIALIDDSTQLGIAKSLVANADGTLSVQEAVTVDFVQYSPGSTTASTTSVVTIT
ncbi:hypothetical protein [Paraburkholderia sp. BCC1886]|uniref:hypothetical protein n=1 Tax=Paraburkholderia sp. BCC1886 TaxID=2562670 RepID=UPI00118331D5|nr:hypothetical protein [Paraburkholderia sp. BCC1886]